MDSAALQSRVQLGAAVALCSLLVFVPRLSFQLSCLAVVFIVLLRMMLSINNHVGTLLLSAAMLLGAVCVGIVAAGVIVTITLAVPGGPVARFPLLAVLACVGFGLVSIPRVHSSQLVLFIQGTNMLMGFGMAVVLSLWTPTFAALWTTCAHMLLALAACALANVLAGVLVLPSLASEAAMGLVVQALQQAGQTCSLCISLLLAPRHHYSSGHSSTGGPPAAAAAAAAAGMPLGRAVDAAGPAGLAVLLPSEAVASSPDTPLDAAGISSTTASHHSIQRQQQRQQQQLWLDSRDDAAGRQRLDQAGTRDGPVGMAAESVHANKLQQEQPPQVWAAEPDRTSSLLLEEVGPEALLHQQLLQVLQQATQPTGHWGVQSFIASHTSAAAAAAAASASHEDDESAAEAEAEAEAAAAAREAQAEDDDAEPPLSARSSLKLLLPESMRALLFSQTESRPQQQAAAAPAAGPSKHHLQQQSQSSQQQQQQQQQPPIVLMRLGRGVDAIRPLLSRVKMMRDAGAVEQAWPVRLLVGAGSASLLDIDAWSELVAALEALVDRVAALEGMLEEGTAFASLASLPSYQALSATCGEIFAQSAALCASLSTALQHKLVTRRACSHSGGGGGLAAALSCGLFGRSSSGGSSAAQPPLLGVCWEVSRAALLATLHSETRQYFQALAAADKAHPFRVGQVKQMISLMFLSTLAQAVIAAGQRLQTAGQLVYYGRERLQAAATAAAAAPAAEAAEATDAATGHPSPSSGRPAQIHAAKTTTNSTSGSNGGGGGGGDGAGTSSSANSTAVWLLLQQLLLLPVWQIIHHMLLVRLPQALKSRAGVRLLLRSRRFQAGFKLSLTAILSLVVAMLLSQFWRALSPSVLMFGFMAVVFSMRERVESSLETVLIRLVTTVVGAGAGALLMFHPATATQPAVLGAIVCLLAAVAAPAAAGQFKLVAALGLITFLSTVMCQYVPGCCHTGSTAYLLGRIVSVSGGAALAMVLNRVLWPWYRSQWCLQEMGLVLELAVQAAGSMYEQEYGFVAQLAAATGSPGPAAAGGAAPTGPQLQQRHRQAPGDAVIIISPPAHSGPAAQHKPGTSSYSGSPGGEAPGSSSSAADQAGSWPQHLQRALGGLLPVMVAVQRDTWISWKRGRLAIDPLVPLMLSASLQLMDALSALRATLDLTTTPRAKELLWLMQQQRQQGAPHTSGSTAASGELASSSNRLPLRSALLFEDLAALVHGDILEVVSQLGLLVALVRQQLDAPSAANHQQLLGKIAEVHRLRVATHTHFILLRNARLKKLHDILVAALQQQQQEAAGAAMASAAADPVSRPQTDDVPADAGSGSSEGLGGSPAGSAIISDELLLMQRATVQFLAFVFAMRRVFNRVMVVARCVAGS